MASNPVIISVPEKIWTPVAINVVTGLIHRLVSTVNYFQTYRLTGGASPTTEDERVKIFEQSNEASISATEAIDVYLWCENNDVDNNDAGSVRVDL